MKKLFTVLVCVLLLGALAISVFAAEGSVTITPTADNLDRGETFTVIAELNNTEAIKNISTALVFDDSAFELLGGTCHVEGAMFATVTVPNKAGTILLSSATAVSGKVFAFNLKVKDDAPFGEYTITAVSGVVLSNDARQDMPESVVTITVACKHAFGPFGLLNEEVHQHTCEKCGFAESEAHIWDEGAVTTPPACETEGVKTIKCLSCEAQRTEPISATGHAWDNDCDTDCNNNCGLTREIVHMYDTTWSTDETGHWYQCTICQDKKDYAEHIPGPEATTEAAQICTECQYELVPRITHEHQMDDTWLTDEDYHWHRCKWSDPTCHYVEDKAEHDYDDECDVDCNTCGYLRIAPHQYRQELEGDVEGHWFVCILCNQKSAVEAHDPGPEATDTEPQRCTQCGIVLAMPLTHVHTFGDVWNHTAEKHWLHCTDPMCIEISSEEPHTWDAGVDSGNGMTQFTCIVCRKQVEVENHTPPTQPAQPTQPTQPTTQPTTADPEKNEPAEASNGFPWEWVAIAAIALLAIGFILLIIEFIRSRRANSHGRFSK